MNNNRSALGTLAENYVVDYLKKEGYSIAYTNYTCRSGEIDIIAHKHDVRAFVEVKFRTTEYFATSQVVSHTKQRKIITTAKVYNQNYPPSRDTIYRFDVALLYTINNDYHITYIPNAFTDLHES